MLVALLFLDYAIFSVLQLTSTGQEPFSLTDLVVNGEFRPVASPRLFRHNPQPQRLPQKVVGQFASGPPHEQKKQL